MNHLTSRVTPNWCFETAYAASYQHLGKSEARPKLETACAAVNRTELNRLHDMVLETAYAAVNAV